MPLRNDCRFVRAGGTALAVITLFAACAVPAAAGVVRQLTNLKTTRIGSTGYPNTADFTSKSQCLDDAGTFVFVNSSTNQLGGNPGHRSQIFRFDASTGAGQQITSLPKGVSDQPGTVSVSDDGQWIAFISRSDPLGQNHDASDEVFVVRPDGSGMAQVTNDPAVNAASVTAARMSGSANRVAFLSYSNALGTNPSNRLQIFVVNVNGTGLRQLTTVTTSAYWYGFSISDDGQKIVFATTANLTGGNADRSTEVFAVQADGTGLRQITSASSNDSVFPEISGDGAKIAYTYGYRIFAINWAGTGSIRLATSSADSPSITDDGQFVFFRSKAVVSGKYEIWKVKTDGTGLTQVTTTSTLFEADKPVVAGGGGRVAYVGNSALHVYDYDEPNELDVVTGTGTNFQQLIATTIPKSDYPEITRDGTRIVFESTMNPFGTNPDGGYEIFRMQTDGSGLAQVTSIASGEAYDPSIAADGTTIVFDSSADPTGQNPDGSREIFLIHADGSGLRQVTNNLGASSAQPKISANGDVIVFQLLSLPQQTQEIARINSDGTGFQLLTNAGAVAYSHRVDDTGTWATFLSSGNLDGTAPNGTFQIWRIRTDATALRRVSTDATRVDFWPDISGSGQKVVYLSSADPLGTNAAHRSQVFLYDASTSQTRQLSVLPSTVGGANAPSISGDGNLVYFWGSSYDETDPDLPYSLYRVPTISGSVERIGAQAPCELVYGHAPRTDMTGSRFAFDGMDDTTGQNPDRSYEIWLGDMTKDPQIHVGQAAPTLVSWDYETGPIRYDVIRGDVANLAPGIASTVNLGPVVCLENDSPDADTGGFEDPVQPQAGHAFFFLYRGSRGLNYGPGSWGQSSNGFERAPGNGVCAP